jgi:choline dehydrogenase-like flavoprotein
MLPYYKRTERRIGIADDRIHGREGNLPVTDIDWIHPICEAFIDGAVGMGIPRCTDYNSGDRQHGVGYFQRAIHRGWRHSAARVFLHPAKATGRLEIRTDARAAAVLFDGRRAGGVRYVDDRDRNTQHAFGNFGRERAGCRQRVLDRSRQHDGWNLQPALRPASGALLRYSRCRRRIGGGPAHRKRGDHHPVS